MRRRPVESWLRHQLRRTRVVVETVVAKYSDHLPLYRQAAILERDAGLEIGRATLDGWVMRVGESLELVVAAMRQDLRMPRPASRRSVEPRLKCPLS